MHAKMMGLHAAVWNRASTALLAEAKKAKEMHTPKAEEMLIIQAAHATAVARGYKEVAEEELQREENRGRTS